jgi:hypothetical protein
VYKRDGCLVPFEADKISRSLFAATESLGRPNAFMARELTDGVLHFLKAQTGAAVPTTAQVAELVIKVVRELGQPALAQVFADYARQQPSRIKPESLPLPPTPPSEAPVGPSLGQLSQWVVAGLPPVALTQQAGRACWRAYTLREVFTRDLVAAQADGLLTLTGLEAPLELAGVVPGPLPVEGDGVAEAVGRARRLAGQVLGIDGPEYQGLARGATAAEPAAAFARDLRFSLSATGLTAMVNLNSASPPSWASDLAAGPLFAEPPRPAQADGSAAFADALLGHRLQPGFAPIRVDWHLGERDFRAGGPSHLLALARKALDGYRVAFVFDRPRRPVALAEGLDRGHPGVLLVVGLHLPELLRQAGAATDAARLLGKLGSLARLALSAGVQKRDFLRRHAPRRPEISRGFLLDRARLVVVPVGLEAAVRELTGEGLCGGGAGFEAAVQVVQRLRDVLRQDGRGYRLETAVDSAADFTIGGQAPATAAQTAGLTAWDEEAAARPQLKAAGALHAAEAGTAAVLIPASGTLTAEEVADLLKFAWQQTDVVRLRFVRAGSPSRQLTAPWVTAG